MASGEAFLARVREAAERGRQYCIHSPPIAEGVGYLGAGSDLVERFALEVTAVGGEAFVVSDLRAAREQLAQLLSQLQARSAVCWQHELLARLELSDLVAAGGIAAHDYGRLEPMSAAERRQLLLACDVGITSCDCGIAETGTLMMCAKPGQERVASLLPPTHIAIIERQQIVPDLIDAFQRLTDGTTGELPSNVTFITGPSKTGDIELQLTTGVHGPGKWLVIVIAE
jgi:L-lactate dehydrogenase complex protein LldG